MFRKLNKLFIITLLLAISLRIFLLIWSVTYPLDNNGDQTRYEDWAQTAHIYGYAKTYDSKYVHVIANNMPPGTIYTISATYEFYILIGKVINKISHTSAGSLHWVNTYLLHIFMRLPNVIADILIGVMLYLLVKKEANVKRGVLAASLIWFNPIVIYNSSIWGQMDGITNLFFVFALFLAFRKNYLLSILSFAASAYIKLSILPLFPFYIVFLYFHSGKQWKKLLLGVFIAAVGVVIATYPISSNPFLWLYNHWTLFSKGEEQNITNAAFNLWWMVVCLPTNCPGIPLSMERFLGISLEIWAYFLFGLLTIPILYLQLTKPKTFIQKKYAFFALAIVALMVFLVMPRMHDRYMYPFFPLIAAVVALSKNVRTYLIFFCVLTLLHFANLLSSWYPTRYPAMIYAKINYNLFYRWSISVLTVITTVLLYRKGFKEFFSKKTKFS